MRLKDIFRAHHNIWKQKTTQNLRLTDISAKMSVNVSFKTADVRERKQIQRRDTWVKV